MKNPPLISFCIPTLNRGYVISDCLSSIYNQGIDLNLFEIVVVDGGSGDCTEIVLNSFISKYENIKYIKSQNSRGIGADLLEAIHQACGKYCWLFSDDDALAPGALEAVIAEFNKLNFVYASVITNYKSYDKSLKHGIETASAIADNDPRKNREFLSSSECFKALGMHVGYISTMVLKRAELIASLDLHLMECHVLSPWIIVYLLGFIQKQCPISLYLGEMYVCNRSDNDSFSQRLGECRRQFIAHRDFYFVIDDLFPEGGVSEIIKKNYLKNRMLRGIIKFKSNFPSIKSQYLVICLYINAYGSYPKFWYKYLPLFFIPSFFYYFIYNLYFLFLNIIHKD